jgi:pyrroline-5-carboxylate reductase
MKKITIIGGGNLGSAIARGLKTTEVEMIVTGRSAKRLQKLQDEGIPTSVDNISACENADYIILCVLPTQVISILEELAEGLTEKQVVISTATGVTTDEIKSFIQGPVVRAMPNTASSIGQSMTCLSSSDLIEDELSDIKSLFSVIGETIVIDEKLMQAATVLGASGIAFFLRFIRAATQGGIQMGFHPHEAQLIAVQTAIGASSLLKVSTTHPEMEIDKVTTPKGCTIEGLNEMEHQGLSSAIIKGIITSYNKINDLR